MIKIIIGCFVLGGIMIGIALYKRFKTRDEGGNALANTLAPYIDKEYFKRLEQQEAEAKALGLKTEQSKLTDFAKVIERIVVFERYREKLALKISQAGVKWRSSEYLTMMLGTAFIGFFLGFSFGKILWNNPLLAALPGAFVGFKLPEWVLGMKKSGRQKKFQAQLVDTLGLISNSLKAGYSFLQAVEMVSREAPTPTREEFTRLLREHSLGLPLDDAMEAMAKRMESGDFELTVTVVLIQRQIGGNLAEILDNIAHTIRERIKLLGTIKALTAQGKMGGMVITALPFGLYIIMYLMNPDVMGMLFKDKIGWILIGIGLIMQGLGAFVIANMLKVEM